MSEAMKAYVYRRYGGPEVIELAEVEKPVPRDNEMLVRIRASTVTAGDWRARTLEMPRGFGLLARPVFGFLRPRQPILGTELAGVIESVGKSVTRFRPGDAVFAFLGGRMGCHAEYRALAEDGPVAPKPDNLSFEEAASLSFGGATALHFLRQAGLRAGDRVLVIGASGGVGTAIVQLARHFGAEITGVTSTANFALVASLGAARCIDYTQENFTRVGETWDIIADTVGATSFSRCRRVLRDKGRLLSIGGDLMDLLGAPFTRLIGSKRVIAGPAAERADYVRELARLATSGALRPVIDRRYDFSRIAEAHAYVATRRKRGSVVVSVASV